MIKAEVVFDGACVLCNGYECFAESYVTTNIYKDDEWITATETLEQAIKYCLEN